MSDTPETQEAVERWQQGKINIFNEMARLETERNGAREKLSHAQALLAEMQDALKLAVKQLLGKKDA
jgi:hypothetical protein